MRRKAYNFEHKAVTRFSGVLIAGKDEVRGCVFQYALCTYGFAYITVAEAL